MQISTECNMPGIGSTVVVSTVALNGNNVHRSPRYVLSSFGDTDARKSTSSLRWVLKIIKFSLYYTLNGNNYIMIFKYILN